jgi:hypothetical protein
MKNNYKTKTSTREGHGLSNKSLLVGFVGGFAVMAGLSLLRPRQKDKRYADHAQERRRPSNMFEAGTFPRRRGIDRSGAKPLFERRQSAYEAG